MINNGVLLASAPAYQPIGIGGINKHSGTMWGKKMSETLKRLVCHYQRENVGTLIRAPYEYQFVPKASPVSPQKTK